ncbi:MAG: phage tail tube protein [Ottowia sp.]|uniref:phage tail tube protein n=1 Tax=Ottowia sp. TaxID=1898956 RepID=UPI003C792F65
MALIPLPNGAKVSLATLLGAAKPISAISNASPAVATAAAHGFTDGKVILLASGWSKIDNSVMRVDGSDTGTFEFDGLDTLNTSLYPAGAGAGSARELTTFTPLNKIPTFETTGGDPKSQTTGYLDYEKDFEVFTGTNPERLNFTVSYQPDSPAYTALVAASESGELQVIRLTLKDGSEIYYPGQLFFNKAPTTTKDQEMVNNVSLALQGEITRFAKYVP